MKSKNYENDKMLVVLAHPDDESFGMGGTIAYYAKRGVEVHLMCATGGEAGSVAAELLADGISIAELRARELRCAGDALGIAHIELMGYRDSGMAGSEDNLHPDSLVAAPLEEVTEQVVRYMRMFRPRVVVTFDPVGGYHHPDHIKIHQATVAAFHAAGDAGRFAGTGAPFQPGLLYYQIFPRRAMRAFIRLLDLLYRSKVAQGLASMLRKRIPNPRRFGRNQDIDLVILAGDEDYPEHVSVDYNEVLEQKTRADECHASQLDFGRQGGNRALRFVSRLLQKRDRYMRAYPVTPKGFRSRDLFNHR